MDRQDSLSRAADISGKLLIVAAAIVLGVVLVWSLRAIAIPIFLAILLATQLYPVTSWLRGHRVPAGLAVAITIIGAALVTALVLVGIVGQFVGQVDDLGEQTRQGAEDAAGWIATHSGPLDWSKSDVDEQIASLGDRISEGTDGILKGVLGGVSAAAAVAAGVLLAFAFLIYMLVDGGQAFRWFRDRFRDENQAEIVGRLGAVAWTTLGSYVRGVMTVAVFDAVLIGAALFILGVPLAAVLTAIVFLLAFIPIIGAWVSGIISTLVALAGVGVEAAIIVAGVSLAVQQLEGYAISPLVYRRQVSLNPMVTLSVVTIGGVLGGVIGAFIAVPLTATLWSVNEEYRSIQDERAVLDPTRPESPGLSGAP
ncbi:MAG: AI-2E family transporter [Actinomycetota bacterium]|nr:AI-2E family transporter [Actinomycetota bacterium]